MGIIPVLVSVDRKCSDHLIVLHFYANFSYQRCISINICVRRLKKILFYIVLYISVKKETKLVRYVK